MLSPKLLLPRHLPGTHPSPPHLHGRLAASTRMSNSSSNITYQADSKDGKERGWERSTCGFSVFLPQLIAMVGMGCFLHFQTPFSSTFSFSAHSKPVTYTGCAVLPHLMDKAREARTSPRHSSGTCAPTTWPDSLLPGTPG